MKDNNTFALIWDMDGTMVDTRHAHWLAWKQTMAAENYVLTRETFLKTFGQRNDTILRDLMGPDLPDAEVIRIGNAKEQMFRDVIIENGVRLLPGADRLIDQAAANGCPQAVVSSAPRKNIATILKVLNRTDIFTVLICAEDVSHGKPHPEGCIAAAQKLGISPSNCIVLEDAPAGLEAARRAGMACIGVLSTHDHIDEADRVASSLEEISLADIKTLIHQHKAL